MIRMGQSLLKLRIFPLVRLTQALLCTDNEDLSPHHTANEILWSTTDKDDDVIISLFWKLNRKSHPPPTHVWNEYITVALGSVSHSNLFLKRATYRKITLCRIVLWYDGSLPRWTSTAWYKTIHWCTSCKWLTNSLEIWCHQYNTLSIYL